MVLGPKSGDIFLAADSTPDAFVAITYRLQSSCAVKIEEAWILLTT